MKGVSVLIFSLNEYELIKPKVELLYPYVDEIVIIDSSTDKKQKRLMKSLEKKYKKVRVVWLPPLGIVEFFYKIGIDECKYEWILMLDSDEIPNKNLLKSLDKLMSDRYDGYKIFREEKIQKFIYMIKFFRKSRVIPTGVLYVHGTLTSNKIKKLDETFKIVHTRSELSAKEERIRSEKYSLVEKFQIGYRMLLYTDEKITFWFYDEFPLTSRKLIRKIRKFRNIVLRISGKVGFFFILASFIIFQDFLRAKLLGIRELLSMRWVKTSTWLIKEILKDFNRYFLFWMAFYKDGFYEVLNLDEKKNLLKLSKKLNFGNNGIENFLKLVNYSYKTKILPNFKYYNSVADITSG